MTSRPAAIVTARVRNVAVVLTVSALTISLSACGGTEDTDPGAGTATGFPLTVSDCGREFTLEVIIGQTPDLVITYGLNLTTQQDLAAAGIDSVVNSGFCDGGGSGPSDGPATFEDDVFPDIELYGRIAGTEQAATAKVAELRSRIAAVEAQPQNPAVTTAAAIGLDGTNLRAYGVASLTHKQIETLGLTDVYSDVPERLVDVSLEEFIIRDPDGVILLSGGGGVEKNAVETLRAIPGASEVTAIRENRIIPLESPYLLGGPLGVDGLERMATAISGYR